MTNARPRVALTSAPGGLIAGLLGLAFAMGPAASSLAQAQQPTDSASVHWEVGVRTDVSNEIYFEESFDDTTFRTPERRSTPETVGMGVARAEWVRRRSPSGGDWRMDAEAAAGSRLQSARLGGRWARPVGGLWRVRFDPVADWRHDETFDRDRRESRLSGMFGARREFLDGVSSLDLRGGGEQFRSSGAGSEFALDRNVLRISAAFEHDPWDGHGVRIEYGVDGRTFPDSARRDHLEHHAAFELRSDVSTGDSWSLQWRMDRRVPQRIVFDSRDQYWAGTAAAETRRFLRPGWALGLSAQLEAQQYDDPDSVLYFDYRIARANISGRVELSPAWTIEAGPRVEWLRAPWNAAEDYVESAGELDAQWIGGHALWSVTPAAGWRQYDAGREADDPMVHSSYAFFEATLIGDHPLPGRLRARLFALGRLERHADSAQDARSLYFSLDVRRLF